MNSPAQFLDERRDLFPLGLGFPLGTLRHLFEALNVVVLIHRGRVMPQGVGSIVTK